LHDDVALRYGLGGLAGEGGGEVLPVVNTDLAEDGLDVVAASAVADMVQDSVRANADESLLNLAGKAHGNPFLVRELNRCRGLTSASNRGPPSDELPQGVHRKQRRVRNRHDVPVKNDEVGEHSGEQRPLPLLGMLQMGTGRRPHPARVVSP
jgi:hypothetical protein